jgi:predicted dehydrogenase
MMRFLFGEVTAVRGTPDVSEALPENPSSKAALADLGASGSLHFANGAVGTINARAKDYFIFEFEILGSTGAIRLGNSTALTLYKPAPARYASDFENLAPVAEAAALLQNRQRRTGAAVSDLLAGLTRGVESVNSIGGGLKALEIALAFHESFRIGGEWVALPLARSSLEIDSR